MNTQSQEQDQQLQFLKEWHAHERAAAKFAADAAKARARTWRVLRRQRDQSNVSKINEESAQ